MLETPSRENSTTLTPFSADELLELGREVLRIEADAVLALVDRLGPAFVDAVRLMLECRGCSHCFLLRNAHYDIRTMLI